MRLIDADALLKGKDDHQIISTHLIWNAPTVDAVPVVRCGECKWARDYKGEMICGRVPLAIWTTMPERYCVDGERRSECD